eukprot:10829375-Ditylum_brightwellii.AAC.1
MKDFIMLIHDKYGIKQKSITTWNPEVNAFMEQAHQAIDNLLHMFEIGTAKFDPDDSWGCILSAVMFVLWLTIHTIHKATPMQLVFRQDMMLSIMQLANWRYIQDH